MKIQPHVSLEYSNLQQDHSSKVYPIEEDRQSNQCPHLQIINLWSAESRMSVITKTKGCSSEGTPYPKYQCVWAQSSYHTHQSRQASLRRRSSKTHVPWSPHCIGCGCSENTHRLPQITPSESKKTRTYPTDQKRQQIPSTIPQCLSRS